MLNVLLNVLLNCVGLLVNLSGGFVMHAYVLPGAVVGFYSISFFSH